MGEKKIANFRLKRNILIGSAIACIAVATIVVTINAKIGNKANNGSLEVASKQEEKPQAITISTRAKNSNNYTEVTSEDEKPVLVPKGYVASPDVEERYVNGVTTDGVREHHGGFVIYERLASDEGKTDEQVQQVIENDLDVAQRTRNQWVWVPIVSGEVSNMYHVTNGKIAGNYYTFGASIYSKETKETREPQVSTTDNWKNNFKKFMEGRSKEEFLQEMREEFYEMLESVKTYGGFYIGRYETGNVRQKSVEIVKGFTSIGYNKVNDISDQSWYSYYKKLKSLRGKNPVKTGVIWDIQWDETLKWLINSGEKTYAEVGSDSTSWGNYSNSTFTYTDTNGRTSTKTSGYAGSGRIVPTGSTEYTKANNIYDLAGNITEITMAIYNESNAHYKSARGGYFNYEGNSWKNQVSSVSGNNPNDNSWTVGCRATLYIS